MHRNGAMSYCQCMALTPNPQADPLAPVLGERMMLARVRAGIESQQMAEMLGLSRNSVTNYEKGRTTPKVLVLRAWAAATGYSVAELTGEFTAPEGPGGGDVVTEFRKRKRDPRDEASAQSRCIESWAGRGLRAA